MSTEQPAMSEPMESNPVQELLDKQAIRDLLARYCELIDEYRLDEVIPLFTPDCVTDCGPTLGGIVIGPETIPQRFKITLSRYKHTHHQLGQVRIEVKGDEATSIAYCIADHEFFDGRQLTVRLQYRDRMRRTPQGWRIAGREMFSTVVTDTPAPEGAIDATKRNLLPRKDPRAG
jgi:ketosteroid isomerase-like protein